MYSNVELQTKQNEWVSVVVCLGAYVCVFVYGRRMEELKCILDSMIFLRMYWLLLLCATAGGLKNVCQYNVHWFCVPFTSFRFVAFRQHYSIVIIKRTQPHINDTQVYTRTMCRRRRTNERTFSIYIKHHRK